MTEKELAKIVDLAILSTVDIVHEVYKVSPTVANLDRTLNIIRARWAVLEAGASAQSEKETYSEH